MGCRFIELSVTFLVISIPILIVYDLMTKKIVTRLLVEQAPKSEFGIVPVNGFGSHAYSGGADIVFVHGLGSNPDTTWTAQTRPSESATTDNKETISWISDFLPQDLPPSIREHTRVFFYNHDSYWQRDAVQTRLWSLGEGLLRRIRINIRNTEEERERDLIFVGHSYGGLIVKQALIQARRNKDFADILDHTNTILFLGTPHIGSKAIKWLTIIAKALQPIGSNPSIIRNLAYDSVPIRDLHRDFVAVANNRVQIVNIFETRKSRFMRLWFIQWDILCVGEDSATYDGPSIQNIALAVDHFGLNKFGSKTADEYKTVLLKLLEPLKQATSRPRGRYSVPLRTIPTYVDRHELSSALEKKLNAGGNDTDSPYALLIHGLGGTGKTQLALKYVEEYRDSYDPVLWIDAKGPEAVRSSFERCADEMQLHVDSTPTTGTELADSRIIQAVLRSLRARKSSDKKWLVVVDNADDVSWGLRTVFPQAGWGSLIITSQDSQACRLIPKCEELRVDIMGPLEARAVLLQHLQWKSDSVPSHVQRRCDDIVKRLGYLALAVDLAGAYIGNEADQETAMAQYLADYGKHQDDLLQRDYFRGLSETDKTVWTVWDKTLDRIQDLEPKASPHLLLAFFARFRGSIVQDELLRLASLGLSILKEHFGEENEFLPTWIEAWIELNEDQWDGFYYRAARDLLIRYSLLQRADGKWPAVTMHSLVQWRAMKCEKDRPWDVWHLIFIAAVCIQSNKESTKPHFRRHIIPQILKGSTLKMAARGFDENQKGFIESNIGLVYCYEGRSKEAEELFEQVIEMRRRVLGEEHPSTLTSIANLASTYQDQGRWKEAEELEVQVMKIRKRVLGEEHPDTLTSIVNLASTYWNQGRWKEAEELEVQVMEISKRVLGEEHPSTLISIANLASTYRNQGRWKEAEKLDVQVIEISKRILGEEHPSTLTSIVNLASTYWNQGRWKEAEELEVQVMEIRKRVLGEEHPSTLTSMANLAFTFKSQSRSKEAISLMKTCFKLRNQILGPTHPHTETSLKALNKWEDGENKHSAHSD